MKELYISQRLAGRVRAGLITAVVRGERKLPPRPGERLRLFFRRRVEGLGKDAEGVLRCRRSSRRRNIARGVVSSVSELMMWPMMPGDLGPLLPTIDGHLYRVTIDGELVGWPDLRDIARAAGYVSITAMLRALPDRGDGTRRGIVISWEVKRD